MKAHSVGCRLLPPTKKEATRCLFDEALIDAKANLNKAPSTGSCEGRTALWQASSNGHANVVQLLVDNKADLNLAPKSGYSARAVAYQNNRVEVIAILKKAGAKVGA